MAGPSDARRGPRPAAGEFVIGADFGTSKAAVVVLDADGSEVFTAAHPLLGGVTGDGWAVQRPTHWPEVLIHLVRKVGQHIPLDRVRAVGMTATSPTLVFIDRRQRLVKDEAIMWHDLHRRGPALLAGAGLGLRKLAAVAADRPDLAGPAAAVLDQGGFLAGWLTGLLSVSEAVLAQKFSWAPPDRFDTAGFEAFGVDRLLGRLPRRVVPTGGVVGPLHAGSARRLGMPAGIPVVSGGYDSLSALVGGGVWGPSDRLLASVGTSLGFYMVPGRQDAPRLGPWFLHPHQLPTGGVIRGGLEAGMKTIGLIGGKLRLNGGPAASDRALEDRLARAEAEQPASTLAMPFGPAPLKAPLPNRSLPLLLSVPDTPTDGLATLVALRRGLAYYLRYAIEDLRGRGVAVAKVHLAGGGTQSPSFCQLLASAAQVPVLDFGPRAAAVGAALLAATAGDRAGHREDAVMRLRRGRPAYFPDPARGPVYEEGYRQFVGHLRVVLGLHPDPTRPEPAVAGRR